jgi:hypothetical protein
VTDRKLGKLPPRSDLRSAHLADYLHRGTLPRAPVLRDWLAGAPSDLGMMVNDQIGDCGFAGMGHAIQTWTVARGKMITPSDDSIVAAYSGCTGYSSSVPGSDDGVVLLDALKYWRRVGVASHKIGAFVRVDSHNVAHVKIAIELFGGLYTGAQLPLSAQAPGKTWTGRRGRLRGDDVPGTWGGHCMWVAAYDDHGLTYVTWGARQTADWQWWLDYADEAWACIGEDWVTGARPAPSGFDLPALRAYLASL